MESNSAEFCVEMISASSNPDLLHDISKSVCEGDHGGLVKEV